MKQIEELPNGNLRIVRPVTICNLRHRHSIVLTEELPELQAQSPLLLAIAHAVDWQQKLDSGQYASIEELAVAVGKERSQVSRTLRLALLSPEIIHQALAGGLPIGAKALLSASIPADREEQKKGGENGVMRKNRHRRRLYSTARGGASHAPLFPAPPTLLRLIQVQDCRY